MARIVVVALMLAAFGIMASASAQQRSCAPNCGSGGLNAQTFSNTTYLNAIGRDRGWSGTEQQIGNEAYSFFPGLHGERRNCTTQRFGNQAYTNCD
jgi:hypothetical protein